MSTPKEKQVIKQKLNSKKKHFLKLLHTPKIPSFTLTNDLREKLDELFCQCTTELEPNDPNVPKEMVEKKVGKRKMKNKVYKYPQLVLGLNESLKLLKKGNASLVMIDENVAHNLSTVIQKMCSTNQVLYLPFDLTNIKKKLNISTLTIITFKGDAKEADNRFNPLYKFISDNILKKETKPNQVNSIKTLSTFFDPIKKPKQFTFYMDKHLDVYSELMRKRLPQKSNIENEFKEQSSFVLLSSNDKQFFPDYLKSFYKEKLQLHFISKIESNGNTGTASNDRYVEQLLGLNDNEKRIEFKPPCLTRVHTKASGKQKVKVKNTAAKRKKT